MASLWKSGRAKEYERMRAAIAKAEAARRAAMASGGGYGGGGGSGTSVHIPSFVALEESPPLPELKDLGLAIEPIVAVREFGVYMDGNDPVLTSFNGVPWPAYEPLYATCGNNPFTDHDAPSLDCQCGIYAWDASRGYAAGPGSLSGEVYLWGDILICEMGYRAEVAYPKSLHINGTPTRNAIRIRDGLADMYGVPVTLGTDPPFPQGKETS